MELKRFEDINEFLKIAKPTLLANEVENNLILGVILHIQSNPDRYKEKYLSIVFRESEVTSIAVCTPPFKLLLWCKNKEVINDISILADSLIQSKLEINGILTKKVFSPTICVYIWQKKSITKLSIRNVRKNIQTRRGKFSIGFKR